MKILKESKEKYIYQLAYNFLNEGIKYYSTEGEKPQVVALKLAKILKTALESESEVYLKDKATFINIFKNNIR